MDHEYSTSALGADQIGWDWFSIQLDNNQELMFFQLRKADGTIDPYSGGTWILSDGGTKRLSSDDFQIQVIENWISPTSQAEYPIGWMVSIPSISMDLEIVPLIPDQEMNVGYTYWEGAVLVDGSFQDSNVQGSGYVEMTGYLPVSKNDK